MSGCVYCGKRILSDEQYARWREDPWHPPLASDRAVLSHFDRRRSGDLTTQCGMAWRAAWAAQYAELFVWADFDVSELRYLKHLAGQLADTTLLFWEPLGQGVPFLVAAPVEASAGPVGSRMALDVLFRDSTQGRWRARWQACRSTEERAVLGARWQGEWAAYGAFRDGQETLGVW